MQLKEAASIAFSKILLPTLDVILDWVFGIKLILGWGYDLGCSDTFADDHVYLGIASLVPAILSALIHLHHWYHFEKVENGGSGRLLTLPTVLLQVRLLALMQNK